MERVVGPESTLVPTIQKSGHLVVEDVMVRPGEWFFPLQEDFNVINQRGIDIWG